MKTINLKEILDKYNYVFFEEFEGSTGVAIEIDDCMNAMKEVCKRVLEIAAEENRKTNVKFVNESEEAGRNILDEMEKSILKTIKSII